MRGVGRTLTAVAVGLLTWLAIVGRVTWPEVVTGVGAAGLAVALSLLDQRAAAARARLPRGWWRGVRGIARDIGRDLATLAAALPRTASRRDPGGFVGVPVPGRDETDLLMAVLGASTTPNTVVVGYDPDGETVLIHQLRVSSDPAADVHSRMP